MRAFSLKMWWLALAAFAVAGALATASSPDVMAGNPYEWGAEVRILKYIDEDGSLSTSDDQTRAEGWEFQITVHGGYADPTYPETDEGGWARSEIYFDPQYESVFVDIAEIQKPGFELLDWRCGVGLDLTSSDIREDFGVTEGGGRFEIPYDETLYCYFYNTPEEEKETPTPTVRPRTATPEATEPPPATSTPPPAPTSTPGGEPAGVIIPPQPPAPVAPVALPSTGSGSTGSGVPWLTVGVVAAMTLAGAGLALRLRSRRA